MKTNMNQDIMRIDLGGVNSYLAKVGDGFILFDTGGYITMDKELNNRRGLLEAGLEKAGCRPGNLKLVILTHGDSDHTANAAYIRGKYKTQIAMHKADLELVESPTLEKMMESFQYRSVLLKLVFLLMKGIIRRVTSRTLEKFEPFSPDILLEEGFDLSEYGLPATVLHIPGHTQGSIAVLTKEGSLISGDIFVNVKKPARAPNATNFKLLDSSAERLLKLGAKMIFPGHGEPYAAG